MILTSDQTAGTSTIIFHCIRLGGFHVAIVTLNIAIRCIALCKMSPRGFGLRTVKQPCQLAQSMSDKISEHILEICVYQISTTNSSNKDPCKPLSKLVWVHSLLSKSQNHGMNRGTNAVISDSLGPTGSLGGPRMAHTALGGYSNTNWSWDIPYVTAVPKE